MPREAALDSTLALLADPYRFIADRCASHRADVFECRILARRMLCLSGPAAAELFYNSRRFTRRGAAPEPLRATLFGKGAVQGLEGSEHQHRMQVLLSLASADRVRELGERVSTQLLAVAVIELMQRALRFLTGAIDFELPPQDFSIDYSRMPALPRDRMRLTEVRLRSDIDHARADRRVI